MAVTKIAQVDVGAGGVTTLDFTSIPQTFTDLMIVASLRSSAGTGYFGADIKLNTVSATGKFLAGSGTAASSFAFATPSVPGTNMTASTFGSMVIYIPNYTSAIAKSVSVDNVFENNAAAAQQEIFAMIYSTVTSGVTAISFAGLTNIIQYSSATLYGVTNGSSGGTVVA